LNAFLKILENTINKAIIALRKIKVNLDEIKLQVDF
jgi:hypothetical protein